jgi:hypothetical protein
MLRHLQTYDFGCGENPSNTAIELKSCSRPVLPEFISVVPQLFQVLVEPSDNSIAEVDLVCISPVHGRMAFSFVFCVFDVFA